MSKPRSERAGAMAPDEEKPRTRWGIAALSAALTLAIVLARLATESWFGDRPALIFILIPILLSAYLGGLMAGLASTVVGAVATNYFVMPPIYQFGFEKPIDAVQWLFLIVVGVLISVFTESLRQRAQIEQGTLAHAPPGSTERKVQGGFAFALAFLAVVGLLSVLGVRRLREDTRWTTHTETVIASLRMLRAVHAEAESAQRGYILTRDASHLFTSNEALASADSELHSLRLLTADNDEQQRQLSRLTPLFVRRVALAKENPAVVESGIGTQLHDQIRGVVAEMEATEYGLLQRRDSGARRIGNITLAVIVVGGALAFGFVSVALLVMQREFVVRRQTEEALLEARERLEGRVRERTAALEQANTALRGSGDRYRDTLDSMMEGCSLVGYDWRYLYVNDTGATHARQRKERLVGRTLQECHPGIEAGPLFADLKRCMEDRAARHVEQQMMWPDGDTTFFELAIEPAPEGILVLSLDVTERRRAQEVLRESQERLLAVTESLNEGLIVSTLDGQLVHWNRAAVLIHGYTNAKEGLRTLADFHDVFEVTTLDGEVVAYDQWPLARVLRGERLRADVVHIRRIGTDWNRVLSYAGSIVNDSSGKSLAVLAIQDVTESQRVEAQVRDQLDELLRWQQVTLDREDRVQALKAEINALLAGQEQPTRYGSLSAS